MDTTAQAVVIVIRVGTAVRVGTAAVAASFGQWEAAVDLWVVVEKVGLASTLAATGVDTTASTVV